MYKTLPSSVILAGVFLALIVTACHAQSPQGFSGNTQQTQTPAAQRENYDPLLDLPPVPNNRVTLIGGTVPVLEEVMTNMTFQPFSAMKKIHVPFETRARF